jgi:hypothetical protein
MERHGVVPSNFTLGILVKMWGRARQLEKAFDAVDSLTKKYNFAPNKEVLTCLISTCLSNHAADRAYEVFERLKQSSYGADKKAYQTMILGLVRMGRSRDAAALVEEAFGFRPGAPRGRLPQPLETETLESLFRTLSQQKLMEEVGAPLLEKLRGKECQVDPRLFLRVVRLAVTEAPGRGYVVNRRMR